MIEREKIVTEKLSQPPRIVSENVQEQEQTFEFSLRPKNLKDFIGQESVKKNLHVFLQAAKKRNEPLEHLLFYGNPGLGKTTLAGVIANEIQGQIRVTSGPALERVGDLAAILSNLKKGDILFIDEIHRMNKTIEEVLYPAMEDFVLDLIVGKGPTARTLRLNLEPFTIIGATTRLSLLSSPLRDRFGLTFHLNFYEENEIEKIIERSASLLQISIDQTSKKELAKRSRKTPRIANRLLRRVRDFAQVKGKGIICDSMLEEAFELLQIDFFGLDRTDRFILSTIIEKFHGGPVGLSTIAAATQEEIATIEEVYEPFLLQLGLLDRTPRGRVATALAYKHLGFSCPSLL
ncbi:Holliday junction branch migration DNA helicase RuvB [Candidatus Uhrbacteria bacterium CG_4_9_14_3_um_filter_36_7]|uniref:Holliday junction branch migration complex subunit RuvB n=1 Tax=Candidatus Uhrbacteria bacterium CG_4_9_14_3_um_filter_36_7 TaxID=1975033 RepID=A0A2M7XHU5_9BACT|nr:MAG: Holliday junction branch migration DNA helicase RuvB [Candidatus Uhrbacteria bacterium CG_4_9_14_3_um_filter_36_7]